MLKKHSVLIGIILGLLFLYIATLVYPGGSVFDKNSIGFVWTKNFISNLFEEKAVNGVSSNARYWAGAGMVFLSISFALFFVNFSHKIPAKHASGIIKYVGAGNMLFTLLIATPLHDIMVTLSATLYLLSMFYITVYVFKSKLNIFKFVCVLTLLIFYFTMYMYGSGDWKWLPILQKITISSSILLVLALEYFTKQEDFADIKTQKEGD